MNIPLLINVVGLFSLTGEGGGVLSSVVMMFHNWEAYCICKVNMKSQNA